MAKLCDAKVMVIVDNNSKGKIVVRHFMHHLETFLLIAVKESLHYANR